MVWPVYYLVMVCVTWQVWQVREVFVVYLSVPGITPNLTSSNSNICVSSDLPTCWQPKPNLQRKPLQCKLELSQMTFKTNYESFLWKSKRAEDLVVLSDILAGITRRGRRGTLRLFGSSCCRLLFLNWTLELNVKTVLLGYLIAELCLLWTVLPVNNAEMRHLFGYFKSSFSV